MESSSAMAPIDGKRRLGALTCKRSLRAVVDKRSLGAVVPKCYLRAGTGKGPLRTKRPLGAVSRQALAVDVVPCVVGS